MFATGSGISDAIAAHQLFQCADEILGDAILKVDPGITNKPVDAVLATMKKLAVIPVAIGAFRTSGFEADARGTISFICLAS